MIFHSASFPIFTDIQSDCTKAESGKIGQKSLIHAKLYVIIKLQLRQKSSATLPGFFCAFHPFFTLYYPALNFHLLYSNNGYYSKWQSNRGGKLSPRTGCSL
jgi:hypothetical protein